MEHIILCLFRKSLFTGKIPAAWLKTRIAFIPKPGKDNYTNPKHFRPISLCSFFLKILEKLILWYNKQSKINCENVFNKNLFSYTESVSTEDPLHMLVNKLEKTLEKGEGGFMPSVTLFGQHSHRFGSKFSML